VLTLTFFFHSKQSFNATAGVWVLNSTLDVTGTTCDAISPWCEDLTPYNANFLSIAFDPVRIVGSTASLSCDTGYELSPQNVNSLQCTGSVAQNGPWTPSPYPTCVKVGSYCLALSVFNGDVAVPTNM
jgi:hypothetical protein